VDGAVMEGRDIGSVVAPHADLKLFLRADSRERVGRRALQRDKDPEHVARSLGTRDQQDARTSPFVPAPDAIVFDTTELSPDEVAGSARAGPRAWARTVTAPAVAVVGRQNVGKSTLVNRMFGSRETIAHEMPGVTRDRVELEATWGGRTLKLIDTGGFAHDAKGIEALVSDQAERAARHADVVLLVVDVQTGPLEEDAALARRLRRSEVPVLVVVNKVDSERDESDVPAFLSLGLGDPVPVSALHGRGSGDLLDQLVAVLPDEEAEDVEPEEPRFAIVGRPNVGKSSLFNRLVGEERSVVYEEAGTTRDAVDALVSWPDGPSASSTPRGFGGPPGSRAWSTTASFVRSARSSART
jgi:GTP-binding protein